MQASSSTSSTSSSCVLCVGMGDRELGSSIVERFRDAACMIHHCPDVYRALARLDRLDPLAVIVSLDWLDESHLEFIRLVRWRRGELPVFVVAGRRSRAKLRRALELGATSSLSEDAVVDCLAEHGRSSLNDRQTLSARQADRCPAVAKDIGLSPVAAVGPVFDTKNVPDIGAPILPSDAEDRIEEAAARSTEPAPRSSDVPNERAAGEAPCGQESPLQPTIPDESSPLPEAVQRAGDSTIPPKFGLGKARVPWLRYEEGPARVPPEQRGQQGSNMEHPGSHGEDLPLLSQEELDALLGDGIADKAAED